MARVIILEGISCLACLLWRRRFHWIFHWENDHLLRHSDALVFLKYLPSIFRFCSVWGSGRQGDDGSTATTTFSPIETIRVVSIWFLSDRISNSAERVTKETVAIRNGHQWPCFFLEQGKEKNSIDRMNRQLFLHLVLLLPSISDNKSKGLAYYRPGGVVGTNSSWLAHQLRPGTRKQHQTQCTGQRERARDTIDCRTRFPISCRGQIRKRGAQQTGRSSLAVRRPIGRGQTTELKKMLNDEWRFGLFIMDVFPLFKIDLCGCS